MTKGEYLVQNFTIAFVESINVPSISKRMPEKVPIDVA